MPRRDLDGAIVVVTGASSGIGRATALDFARAGADLVLAARSGAELGAVARECERHGARALALPLDTGDAAAMRRLAEQAAGFGGGRIDVWVNNAGVAAFGPFTDTPIEAHERVIRTNLIGYINGAHAVLPVFLGQGHGVLINLVSMAGWAPTPLASSYSASKYGIRGFSEALRIELAASGADIHVCDVYPAFVDTPILEHSANYSGRKLKPVPPVLPVRRVSRAIVRLATRPRPMTPLGAAFPAAVALHTAAPALFRRAIGRAAAAYLKMMPQAEPTDADLYRPSSGNHGVSGGLRSPILQFGLGVVSVAGAALGAAWLLRRSVRGDDTD